jgi:hypothetical protein
MGFVPSRSVRAQILTLSWVYYSIANKVYYSTALLVAQVEALLSYKANKGFKRFASGQPRGDVLCDIRFRIR